MRISAFAVMALILVEEAHLLCAGETSRQPNIVFLFTDDQRSDAVGYAGNEKIQTPNMDRLAQEGLRFDNCFVTTSICCISRASVLSGQYARRHDITGFNTTFSPEALQQTYPALLQRHGYYTGFIGKWGVGTLPEKTNVAAKMFDDWQGQPHQTNFWHEADCAFVKFDGKSPHMAGVCDCPPDARGKKGWDVRIGKANMREPKHLSTEIIPAKIEQFLENRDLEKPFCLSLFFKAPHDPQDYDPRYENLYENLEMPIPRTSKPKFASARPDFLRKHQLGNASGGKWAENHALLQTHIRNYYRLVSGADYAIGKLIESLESRGLAENTVILFTSDNGSFHGEHGFAGKWLMREPSIRVPGFVYDPRLPLSTRNRCTGEMVLNIDFTATILDLAGVEIPSSMQGRSLRKLTEDASGKWREDWFYEHEYTHGGAIQPIIGVRSKDWKYTLYTKQDPPYEELFDLITDPDEVNNLASEPEYQERLSTLRRRCNEYKLELE